MQPTSTPLGVLTAMITPAVLISACGTLILSTTTRLSRANDLVRQLSDRFEELTDPEAKKELPEERRLLYFKLLEMLTIRSRILQRCLSIFYMSVGIFVATSLAIGVVSVVGSRFSWVTVVLALIGGVSLLWGSLLLILEARVAYNANRMEMDFIKRLAQLHLPPELADKTKLDRSILEAISDLDLPFISKR